MNTQYIIPTAIINLLDDYDLTKIVNAVQGEINAGTVKKSSNKTSLDWKTVKADGNERQIIISKNKTGETLHLERGPGARFFGWSTYAAKMQSFGTTDIKLPETFKTWLDKFAKK